MLQPIQQSNDSTPAVVRLGLGAALFVMGIHLLFAGLRVLLNLWVALTPGKDRQWRISPNRV
jgi:hypothetical protein